MIVFQIAFVIAIAALIWFQRKSYVHFHPRFVTYEIPARSCATCLRDTDQCVPIYWNSDYDINKTLFGPGMAHADVVDIQLPVCADCKANLLRSRLRSLIKLFAIAIAAFAPLIILVLIRVLNDDLIPRSDYIVFPLVLVVIASVLVGFFLIFYGIFVLFDRKHGLVTFSDRGYPTFTNEMYQALFDDLNTNWNDRRNSNP